MVRGKTPKVNTFLDRALKHIHSVPYRVPLRWAFYRVWQEGLLQVCWKQGWKRDRKTKQLFEFEETPQGYKQRCYQNFIASTSSARKQGYRGWKRDSVTDDTRQMVFRGIEESHTKEDWVKNLSCRLDKFQNQNYFVMIMFEAQSMKPQFEHLTKYIPLIPSRGEFTIDYKNSIALAIEWAFEKYNKPIIVLYFGDCDKKGRKIRSSAIKDIHEWCRVDFEDFYCGLTESQAKEYKLPDNPDKPNEYQWESLSDEQARKIVLPYIKKYQIKKRYKDIENLEKEYLKEAKDKLLKTKIFPKKKSH